MSTSLQYSALSRILDLNTRVSNLQTRMMAEPVSATGSGRIAEMQEEIERWKRTSLAVCWLADSEDEAEA
jgi:hypothetical protein